jgi:hypothetical protein
MVTGQLPSRQETQGIPQWWSTRLAIMPILIQWFSTIQLAIAGTTGAGYGELNGAKPLDEDWHNR